MQDESTNSRRDFLMSAAGTGLAAMSGVASAQSVFSPQGKAIAHIRLPERCANLCFGGPKNNRLYMASCHSLYALYVEAHGAT